LKMHWVRFVAFNILGAGLWVSFWGGTTYYLGGHLAAVFGRFKRIEFYLLIGVAFLGAAYLIYRVVSKGRKKRQRD